MTNPRKEETKDSAKFESQDAWGNSIANLRHNLRLTPLERLRQAEDLARFVAKYRGIARSRTPV